LFAQYFRGKNTPNSILFGAEPQTRFPGSWLDLRGPTAKGEELKRWDSVEVGG